MVGGWDINQSDGQKLKHSKLIPPAGCSSDRLTPLVDSLVAPRVGVYQDFT